MLFPGPKTCQQVTVLERRGKPDKGGIYASPPYLSLIQSDFLIPCRGSERDTEFVFFFFHVGVSLSPPLSHKPIKLQTALAPESLQRRS